MKQIRGLVVTMRPHQWIKNLLLFAGLIFAGGLTDLTLVGLAASGFVVFCLLSGAVYLLNDIADLERDRRHPEKRSRPLASGEVAVPAAAATAVVAVTAALWRAYALHPSFGHTAVGFLALNLLYSLTLRKMVILDVLAIAVGFVLRAVGSVEVLRSLAPTTELSPWLLVCTFFLALFLGFGKRRAELGELGERAAEHRATLGHYPRGFIDSLIGIVTAATIVAYAIYTIWPGTVEKVGSASLVYTVPFVVYGIFRYLYLMHVAGGGGRPSHALVTDRPLVLNIGLWVLVVVWIIYWAR